MKNKHKKYVPLYWRDSSYGYVIPEEYFSFSYISDEDSYNTIRFNKLRPDTLYYVFSKSTNMDTYAAVNESGDYVEYTGIAEQTDKLIHELEVQGYTFYEILESLRI